MEMLKLSLGVSLLLVLVGVVLGAYLWVGWIGVGIITALLVYAALEGMGLWSIERSAQRKAQQPKPISTDSNQSFEK